MKRSLYLTVSLLFPFLGHALVAPNQPLTETDPLGSQGLDWDYVVNYKTSSAVAIAPRWLITAEHVADDPLPSSFVIGGTTYNEVSQVAHPDADFALIEVDADLPGFYDIYTGPLLPGGVQDVLMVGYGGVGTITDSTNHTLSTSGRNTKRWGTNKIENTVAYVGGFGNFNLGIEVEFDTTDSLNEAGVGVGDSGGAVFINNGGTWELAGVMTDASAGSIPGNAGGMLAIAPQAYSPFIYAVIPEVSSIWMVSGGLGLLLVAFRLKARR